MTADRRYHLHASLGYRLTRAARISERRFEDLLAQHGLTRVFWCVLLAVGEEGLETPSDIADFVRVDRAVISRALGTMEARGLVERTATAGDGRRRIVCLTAAGSAALDASIPLASENARHFADRMTDQEQDMFLHLLERLVEGEDPTVRTL